MIDDLCRCGRHRLDCACKPDPASLEWSTERAYSHGKNVVSLSAHRRRRDWNRHIRKTWGGDDHAE